MKNQRILANDIEIDYAKKNGLQDSLNLSLLPFAKRITSINRANLKQNSNKMTNEINGFLDKHPESKVFFIAQFNKGDIRSKEELGAITQIQLKSNLETFLFQELSEDESLSNFREEFIKVQKLAGSKEIFALVDIRSKDIEDKIEFLLSNKVKNIIIRGGDYDNIVRWSEIRLMIHKSNSEFGISVNRRWDSDKVSYLKYALAHGCDYTFHEKPTPFNVDKKSILNLNENFVYSQMDVNGDYGVSVNEDNAYSFSRARTLIKAQELAPKIELLKIA